jgi:alcohol dehydrogenase YqhD (iron-dependent ADH family)
MKQTKKVSKKEISELKQFFEGVKNKISDEEIDHSKKEIIENLFKKRKR